MPDESVSHVDANICPATPDSPLESPPSERPTYAYVPAAAILLADTNPKNHQVPINFLPGDTPDVNTGQYVLNELDHAFLFFKRGEPDSQGKVVYTPAECGDRPGFVEFAGKPVLRFNAKVQKWCLQADAGEVVVVPAPEQAILPP